MSAEEKRAAFPVRLVDIPERQVAYIRVTNAFEMSKVKMPALRYAAIRVSGDIHKVATAWDYLYRDWLIHSAFEPEHAPALEVFLDKESATDWSHFELDLCLPVRKPGEMHS